MGLYLARRTARALGGDLTLAFPDDGGTLATVSLPRVAESA
jgi:signal transduction histidine kinase